MSRWEGFSLVPVIQIFHMTTLSIRTLRLALLLSQPSSHSSLYCVQSYGYSVTVSAEGHGSVNERVPHHRVVSGVPRDAQTSASRSHESVQTLVCVIGSDEQRVTDTSSE